MTQSPSGNEPSPEILQKIAGESCQASSSSSKTGLRLTQRHWRRTGLGEIAQSGHRIRLISTLLTIMCGVRGLTSNNAMYRSQRTFRSWRPSWMRSGMTCHKAQLMKQHCHFAKGFRHALKQLVDISNMRCKTMFVTLTFPFALQLRHLLFRVITGWLELLITE